MPPLREYELLPEAQAKLSVILNSFRFSLPVYCLYPPTPAASYTPLTLPAVSLPPRTDKAVGLADSTHGDGIWSSLGRQKVKRGLLVILILSAATAPTWTTVHVCRPQL
jgi:hypothetical protein